MVEGILVEQPIKNRQKTLKLIRKWGDANADGLLEDSCQFYTAPKIEGIIGYKVHSNNAVVFGDPVCSPQNKPKLAKLFQEYCKSNGMGVVYTIVSKEFADWAERDLSGVIIEFGENFILDPQNNPIDQTGAKAVLVRKKVKQASKEGITVEEYLDQDPETEKQIENVANEWLSKRYGLQLYLSHVSIFNHRYGKRWFYAKQNGRIVGLLMLNKLEAKNGWLMNNVMSVKNAPHGSSELMVITALQTLAKENCHYVLIGPIASQQLGKISGISPRQGRFIHWIYKCAQLVFHFTGSEVFWQKFQPEVEGSYVLFPEKNLKYSSIKALFQAFNAGLAK